MNETQEKLARYMPALAMVRAALWGGKLELSGAVDWAQVFRDLKDQACGALAVDALAEAEGVDAALGRQWMLYAMQNIRKWEQVMKAQTALTALLEEAGIPFVILKGFAAAMYYPKPEYRAMGDVDLIVAPEDFDRAEQVMVAGGYALNVRDYERHHEFQKDGVEFELHRTYAVMANQNAAQSLDQQIFDGLAGRQPHTIGKYTAPVLEDAVNGLVLLVHINQHMETGLGLRQIIDWMLFVDKCLDDDAWNGGFGADAEKIGLKSLAVTVTRMCQMYLGLREDITWCRGAEADLCDEVMLLTMERGNFGQKIGQSKKTVPILNAMRKITKAPAMLQQRGCENWKALEKWPFLKPFAWFYQICRYIKKGLMRHQPIRSLLADIRNAGREDDIMTRLGITLRINQGH